VGLARPGVGQVRPRRGLARPGVGQARPTPGSAPGQARPTPGLAVSVAVGPAVSVAVGHCLSDLRWMIWVDIYRTVLMMVIKCFGLIFLR
jgi:hypothetical protein